MVPVLPSCVLGAGRCHRTGSAALTLCNGQAISGTFVPRLYNSYNHARAPGQHMWLHYGRVLAHGPTPSAPKWWKSDVYVKSYIPVRARLPLTKSKEEKLIESAAILNSAQKQVQIWGPHFSLILGFRSPNFGQRNTLVYSNGIHRHLGFWEKKCRENYWDMRVHHSAQLNGFTYM